MSQLGLTIQTDVFQMYNILPLKLPCSSTSLSLSKHPSHNHKARRQVDRIFHKVYAQSSRFIRPLHRPTVSPSQVSHLAVAASLYSLEPPQHRCFHYCHNPGLSGSITITAEPWSLGGTSPMKPCYEALPSPNPDLLVQLSGFPGQIQKLL